MGLAFANKTITAEQLLDLRESKHAAAFREWLSFATPREPHDEIVRWYVESLGQPSSQSILF